MGEKVVAYRKPLVARLLLIALFAEIGYATLNMSTMPIYLTKERHFGTTVMSLILGAFLLAEALGKSPMGALADRIGPKKLIAFGPLLSVASAAATLLVPYTGGSFGEAAALSLLRVLDGLALAMIWPAAFALMNASVDDRERHQAMSLLNLVYLVGIALAFPVGGFANDLSQSTRAGIVLAMVLFAACALFAYKLIPDIKVAHEEDGDEHAPNPKSLLTSLKTIPQYLLIAFITFIGVGVPVSIFKLFPHDQFDLSESKVGLAILPGALGAAILSVPLSRLGEMMGRARAVHLGLGLCTLGMAIISSGMMIPAWRTPLPLVLGAVPVGLGFLLALPAWMASVSDIDPRQRGTNIGAVMTAQGLGTIVGLPLGGFLYEKMQPVGESLGLGPDFGRYMPFAVCALAIGVGWWVSLRVLRPGDEVNARAVRANRDEGEATVATPTEEPEITAIDVVGRVPLILEEPPSETPADESRQT